MKWNVFIFLLFLPTFLFAQSEKSYLVGKGVSQRIGEAGIKITQKQFDSLLTITKYVFSHTRPKDWELASCMAAVRITNTIRLKRLEARKYKTYYEFIQPIRDSIWYIIAPEAFEYLPLLNYRAFNYELEWETFPNDNSFYAVVFNKKNKRKTDYSNYTFGIKCSQQQFDSLFSRSFYLLSHCDSANWQATDCIDIIRLYNTLLFTPLLFCEEQRQVYRDYIQNVDKLSDYIWWKIEPVAMEESEEVYRYSQQYNLIMKHRPHANSMFYVYDREPCK
ncbi:MAG: hypothetical protein ACKVTZ_10125 [Bacteroidia bacterium]